MIRLPKSCYYDMIDTTARHTAQTHAKKEFEKFIFKGGN